MAINKKPNKIALEFVEKIAGIASNLTNDQLLYWSRKNEEGVENIFDQEVEFLTYLNQDFIIPPMPACKPIETFHRKDPFSRGTINTMSLNEAKKILKLSYPETFEVKASGYQLTCALEVEEVLRYLSKNIGGKKNLVPCSLTPLQIRYVANNQSRHGVKGILSTEECNYFLIAGKKDRLGFMSMWWGGSSSVTYGRNVWKHYFHFEGDSARLREKGRIIIV